MLGQFCACLALGRASPVALCAWAVVCALPRSLLNEALQHAPAAGVGLAARLDEQMPRDEERQACYGSVRLVC